MFFKSFERLNLLNASLPSYILLIPLIHSTSTSFNLSNDLSSTTFVWATVSFVIIIRFNPGDFGFSILNQDHLNLVNLKDLFHNSR